MAPLNFDYKSGDVKGTNIDLAIIDRANKVCLCLELKWLIGASRRFREIEDRTEEHDARRCASQEDRCPIRCRGQSLASKCIEHRSRLYLYERGRFGELDRVWGCARAYDTDNKGAGICLRFLKGAGSLIRRDRLVEELAISSESRQRLHRRALGDIVREMVRDVVWHQAVRATRHGLV